MVLQLLLGEFDEVVRPVDAVPDGAVVGNERLGQHLMGAQLGGRGLVVEGHQGGGVTGVLR